MPLEPPSLLVSKPTPLQNSNCQNASSRKASETATSRGSRDVDIPYGDYGILRSLASQLLRRHQRRPGLEATSLVHEAFLRLARQRHLEFRDQGHFLATASRAMRFVLVDHFRRRRALKRGEGHLVDDVPVDEVSRREEEANVLAINDLLERLAEVDPRKAQVVELRFFGGLAIKEVAEITDSSPATVKRDWAFAKAWLLREMSRE